MYTEKPRMTMIEKVEAVAQAVEVGLLVISVIAVVVKAAQALKAKK